MPIVIVSNSISHALLPSYDEDQLRITFDVWLVLPTSHHATTCCYLRGGVTAAFLLGLRAFNERTPVEK